jgi:hypothetical protein
MACQILCVGISSCFWTWPGCWTTRKVWYMCLHARREQCWQWGASRRIRGRLPCPMHLSTRQLNRHAAQPDEEAGQDGCCRSASEAETGELRLAHREHVRLTQRHLLRRQGMPHSLKTDQRATESDQQACPTGALNAFLSCHIPQPQDKYHVVCV